MDRGQGTEGLGSIEATAELMRAVREALILAQRGSAALIDARVMPGYNSTMATGMTRPDNETIASAG